jgi:hypothetical protein
MIFKQVTEIIDGTKTQTRRLVKPDEHGLKIDGVRQVWTSKGRIKWQIARDYAVQSGRGKPTVMWEPESQGYIPLRIRITDIRKERVQDISEQDAIAEGITASPMSKSLHKTWQFNTPSHTSYGYSFPADAYAALWDSINTKKGTRFSDNPSVWVLTFEVLR